MEREIRPFKESAITKLACLILVLPLVQAKGTVFDAVDLWPEEGRPVFEASSQDLTLRAVVPTENSTWPLQSLACASRKSRNVRLPS